MASNIISEMIMNKLPSGASVLKFGIVIVVILIIAGMVAWLIYIKIKQKMYNKKIVLFRKVGGQISKVGEDLAMFERIGIGGDYWCRVKKSKKILPRPRIQMERNTFWFYEREDGEWINIGLEDFDDKMKKLKVNYVDEDMRLQRLGIQKNLIQRFQKLTFLERYGGMIAFGFFVLIITVCLVVILQKMQSNWNAAVQATAAIRDYTIAINNLLVHNGGGLKPV